MTIARYARTNELEGILVTNSRTLLINRYTIETVERTSVRFCSYLRTFLRVAQSGKDVMNTTELGTDVPHDAQRFVEVRVRERAGPDVASLQRARGVC